MIRDDLKLICCAIYFNDPCTQYSEKSSNYRCLRAIKNLCNRYPEIKPYYPGGYQRLIEHCDLKSLQKCLDFVKGIYPDNRLNLALAFKIYMDCEGGTNNIHFINPDPYLKVKPKTLYKTLYNVFEFILFRAGDFAKEINYYPVHKIRDVNNWIERQGELSRRTKRLMERKELR